MGKRQRGKGRGHGASRERRRPEAAEVAEAVEQLPGGGEEGAFAGRDRPVRYRTEQQDEHRWLVPRQGRMLAEGLIYASPALIGSILSDPAVDQVANVAHLPGLVDRSMAMPDIHWGYGFPIGGVAAFDAEEGMISPGGVGFDINCGVRLLASGLQEQDVRPRLTLLLDALEQSIPSGLGQNRRDFRLSSKDLRRLLEEGAAWVVRQGLGEAADLERTESTGRMADADPDQVSERAVARGLEQIGTLGSGNHFCEVGYVERVLDAEVAAVLGLSEGQVTVIVHTGSRGLGYQVCQDSLKPMAGVSRRLGLQLPDRQLACAPLSSPEGRSYLGAMNAAANFAYANRQAITHWVRQSFELGLHLAPADHRLRVVYDVAHNMARLETHEVEGKRRRLCVHRKGATRAFPPGHAELPRAYRGVGQPVLIPGDMGRASYVLVGTAQAAAETFGSVCHGAGRRLSRAEAVRQGRGRDIFAELAQAGVQVRVHGRETLAEEMPEAYKDVAAVVEAVAGAGLARIVARLRPIGVVKG
ncbi:MAG: RtcB family protein [Deltaproteobacteria bacterium]|nr:RtcB family protein [Deltaproteobacteria bacterium]